MSMEASWTNPSIYYFRIFKNEKSYSKSPVILKKIKNTYKEASYEKVYKTDPPKVGILIKITISKFSKTKNQTQKRPPQSSKKSKTYIRRPQIKKYYKTDPTKSGNSDSKYNFKIFKNQKSNSKKAP